jgi:hypothetical protein
LQQGETAIPFNEYVSQIAKTFGREARFGGETVDYMAIYKVPQGMGYVPAQVNEEAV